MRPAALPRFRKSALAQQAERAPSTSRLLDGLDRVGIVPQGVSRLISVAAAVIVVLRTLEPWTA